MMLVGNDDGCQTAMRAGGQAPKTRSAYGHFAAEHWDAAHAQLAAEAGGTADDHTVRAGLCGTWHRMDEEGRAPYLALAADGAINLRRMQLNGGESYEQLLKLLGNAAASARKALDSAGLLPDAGAQHAAAGAALPQLQAAVVAARQAVVQERATRTFKPQRLPGELPPPPAWMVPPAGGNDTGIRSAPARAVAGSGSARRFYAPLPVGDSGAATGAGCAVTAVRSGSAAALAGMRVGDTVKCVGRAAVRRGEDMARVAAHYGAEGRRLVVLVEQAAGNQAAEAPASSGASWGLVVGSPAQRGTQGDPGGAGGSRGSGPQEAVGAAEGMLRMLTLAAGDPGRGCGAGGGEGAGGSGGGGGGGAGSVSAGTAAPSAAAAGPGKRSRLQRHWSGNPAASARPS
jgi:hypothetical protein